MRKQLAILTTALLITSCTVDYTKEPINTQSITEHKDSNQQKAESEENITNDQQEESKEQEQPIEPEVFGDDNCRSDNDCSTTCTYCDTATKKCLQTPYGQKAIGCSHTGQQCGNNGECECIGNFTMESGCSECKEHYWGDNCQHISTSCEHGVLDRDTGTCLRCNEGWSGYKCHIPNDCEYGTGNFGIYGNGKCQTCFQNGDWTTNCTTCKEHFISVDGGYCNDCEPGWKLEGTTKCVEHCSVEGTERITAGGSCICLRPYTSDLCNFCAELWSMPSPFPYYWSKSFGYYLNRYEAASYEGTWTKIEDCRYAIVKDRRDGYGQGADLTNPDGSPFSWTGRRASTVVYSQETNLIVWASFYMPNKKTKTFYYKWEEAKEKCPDYWRLPTKDEASEFNMFVLNIGEYGPDNPIIELDQNGDYAWWINEEVSPNNSKAYALVYSKNTKSLKIELRDKSEELRVLCVKE